MTAPQTNIVQAEFFHVDGGETHSLEVLQNQIRERLLDSFRLVRATGKEVPNGIKTGIRFYDTDGSVTRQVRGVKKWEGAYDATLEILGKDTLSELQRWWFQRKLRRVGDKKRRAKKAAVRDIVRAFARAVRARRPAAIEKNDHSYRLI